MIVVAAKYGQLGNRLFLFASFVATAAEHGLRVANPAFGEYADEFAATAADPLCRYPPRRARVPLPRALAYGLARAAAGVSRRLGGRPWPVLRAYDDGVDVGAPAFVELARRRLVFVQGWLFRDPPSFERHADAVRAFFRPLERHETAARTAVAAARARGDVLVGVHVRRGDYRTFAGGRYFYEPDVYAGAMRRVAAQLAGRRAVFLLCTDEPHDVAAYGGLELVRGPGHPVADLHALAGCDYLVGPPSTFTAWASFYGRVPLRSLDSPTAALELDRFAVFSPANADAT